MLLRMRDVSKNLGPERILQGISCALDRGQSLAIVAPSGVGKSTLLSIAGLLLVPSAGDVVIDDRETACQDDNERSHLRATKIGFLFQHTQLIGSLRAIENVIVPARFAPTATQKLSKIEIAERAKKSLTALGLEDRLYHYPHQLSVGQKRRVATARALFLCPALIIADEPTNDLDDANAHTVVEALFRRVRSGDAGLLFATHEKRLAKQADTILYL
ncbi:MAG: ATP-binding cassette domain-containing protein [Coriobacteriales bacterium]|jgi:ABC-type lipoprotein export system ATPase subunit|nr:ATP-binding cassette domain-containing protein [Coriobacteriales bacterium]